MIINYARAARPRVCGMGGRDQTRVLPDINVPAANIPGFPGLLPITALGSDLEVTIPVWSGANPSYVLQAGWKLFDPDNPNEPGDNDLVGAEVPLGTIAPGTIYTVLVPQALLVNGIYLLRLRTMSPGGNTEWSDSYTVTVDTVAPGGGALAYLTFNTPVQDSKTVYDEDIENGKLWGYLPHYEGIARGDTLTPYLGNQRLDADAVEVLDDPINVPQFIPIGFSETTLLANNGQALPFGYRVKDKAGNEDPNTRVVALTLDLQSKPENLVKPVIPAFDADGIISDGDVRPDPLVVRIPGFAKARMNDSIVVHWGSQTANGVPVTDPAANPILEIEMPYQLIKDAGDGTIAVTYEVFRNGNSVGTSPVETVEVDLQVPGGDPDPGNPDHPNLSPLLVRGDSGEDNRIPPQDYGKDAVAIIPWLAQDGSDYLREDDLIRVYWGTQPALVPPYSVSAQDVIDKNDIEITVPTAVIEAEASGLAIPVWYTVSREIGGTPPASNTSKAAAQPVEVVSSVDLPGGGVLDPVTFTRLSPTGYIAIAQLIGVDGARYNPISTKVNYSKVVENDTVELFFSGYDALTGGNPVPAADYTSGPIPLTQGDLNLGSVEFRVPAVYHAAICEGRAEAYVVIKNSVGPSRSIPATIAGVDVKNPGDSDCSNTPT